MEENSDVDSTSEVTFVGNVIEGDTDDDSERRFEGLQPPVLKAHVARLGRLIMGARQEEQPSTYDHPIGPTPHEDHSATSQEDNLVAAPNKKRKTDDLKPMDEVSL